MTDFKDSSVTESCEGITAPHKRDNSYVCVLTARQTKLSKHPL